MFINFEGSEGSGKTSQIAPLAEFLSAQDYNVVMTREPGGSQIGEQIRSVILDLKNTAMHPRTEILLLQAARAQHVEQLIRPQLELNKVVLCDRFADSTLAYQGFGYQLVDMDMLRAIVAFAVGGLKPDLTLLFDLDVEEGLQRRSRGGEWNRLDAYELAFYQRVRQGYHQLVSEEPERWVIIDASQPFEHVQAEVRKVVLERLRLKAKVQG